MDQNEHDYAKIEEIEAFVAIFDEADQSTKSASPQEKLKRKLHNDEIASTSKKPYKTQKTSDEDRRASTAKESKPDDSENSSNARLHEIHDRIREGLTIESVTFYCPRCCGTVNEQDAKKHMKSNCQQGGNEEKKKKKNTIQSDLFEDEDEDEYEEKRKKAKRAAVEKERRDAIKERLNKLREILTNFLEDKKCTITALLDATITTLETKLQKARQGLTNALQKATADQPRNKNDEDNEDSE